MSPFSSSGRYNNIYSYDTIPSILLYFSAQNRVIPTRYIIPASAYSVNGSSATGHCSTVTDNGDGTSTCMDPTSSVLFDGIIPTLTGLDGNMWASQLLTLRSEDEIDIPIAFSDTTRSLMRVEVVMINCTQRLWTIRVHETVTGIDKGSSESNLTSCDSLVRVCATFITQESFLSLRFNPITGSDRLYLAEVLFYNDNSTCPPDTTITTPTPPPDTTVTTPTPPPDTTITTPTPPPDTTVTTPTPPPDTTVATPTPPLDTTITTPETVSTPAAATVSTSEGANSTLSTELDEKERDPNDSTVIILSVVFTCLFILVCVVAAFLLLWRCYCAKHHKHNTTALGEGTHASPHSHPPPVALCEETGQALYSVVQDEAGENEENYSLVQHENEVNVENAEYAVPSCDRSDFQYDVIQGENKSINLIREYSHDYGTSDTGDMRGRPQFHGEFPTIHREELKGEDYSSLSHGKKLAGQVSSPLSASFSGTPGDQMYAELSNNSMKYDRTFSVTREPEHADQVYSQVDDTRKTIKTQHPSSVLAEDMYAQINKENTAITNISTPGPADQEYAEIDVKRSASTALPPIPHSNTVIDHEYSILTDERSVATKYPAVLYSDEPYDQSDTFDAGADAGMTVTDPDISDPDAAHNQYESTHASRDQVTMIHPDLDTTENGLYSQANKTAKPSIYN